MVYAQTFRMEETKMSEQLLVFAWQHDLFDKRNLQTRDGLPILVIDVGKRSSGTGPEFRNAEVVIGGKTYIGDIAVHHRASDWGIYKRNYDKEYDGVILNVVDDDDRIILKISDTVLPSVAISYPGQLKRNLLAVMDGASRCACGTFLAREIMEIEKKSALTRLMIERLERKYNDMVRVYESVERSWHETFYIMLFAAIGMGRNKEVYMSLARSVPYAKVCHERGDVHAIEAMLFGVAGLLDDSLYDEYKADLGRRFDRLRIRYDLKVMTYCEWTDKGVRPHSFTPRRIAQLAKLIDSNRFTFDNLLACKNIDEVRRMFDMELSDYWKRNCAFGNASLETRKPVGDMTVDAIIINLVVPVLFAFGRQRGDVELEERAVEYLYHLAAERNRYTNKWIFRGVKLENAFDSQAFIQLSKEYCLNNRCCECFIGVKALKKI